ncbi:hypothetical protein [Streptomyces sp. bgisy159]|uniref:hypothetical protein n=1 Tax=Streptomyces sp. bgisy159 TaxID=3413795 RepID=UPI003F4A2185
MYLYSGNFVEGGQDQTQPFSATPTVIGTGGWRDFTNLAVDDINGDGVGDLIGRNPSDGKLYLYPGQLTGTCPDSCTFSLGTPTEYGSGGWTSRPYLTSPGNIQGTVVDSSVEDWGQVTQFKQFQPTANEEYGDFWATTPADPDLQIQYVDSGGTLTSTTCPTGCLLTYPGGPTTHRKPYLAGTAGWGTLITGIF